MDEVVRRAASDYQALLRDEKALREELEANFFARMHKAHLTFGGRTLCPFPQPNFVSPDVYRQIQGVCRGIFGAIEKAETALGPALFDRVDLTPEERELVAIPSGYRRSAPNARLVRDGQMNVLKPYVDRGDIQIVAEQWAKDWQPVEALKIMENALTRNQNQVDAVVTSNDGTAGGAIQALAEQKLTGQVLVSGQDAELGACQRIVAGTQSMTVYKPIRELAKRAAEIAVALGQKQALPAGGQTIPNGKKDVPAFLIDPVQVDKDNLVATVVKDGWQKLEDIYKDVPKDQWPK